eukprot:TRINITY_DN20005_c0_g1_i2.p1 TRINITY_DN20005_c0_g1~~TRINITY_DN20005_c0_g1_i2.p1  ORF type:complete len:454 (+),score=50.34 TRINITY_DN20005_c0_g1_i2:226-1587(+)
MDSATLVVRLLGPFLFLLFPDCVVALSGHASSLPDYRPRFHHTPCYRYGVNGTGGDTAGAVFVRGRYHVFALSREGVQHASTDDLVHWTDHGTVANLDDSGGITIDPTDGSVVALSAAGLVGKFSVSKDPMLAEWGPLETVFSTTDDRAPAMPFPGDPFPPWQDPRNGRWYTAIALDGCNATERNASMDYACPKGGLQQIWSSPELRGNGSDWQPAGTLFTSTHTAPSTGEIPQVTEFVTPDFYPPMSMSTSPDSATAVFVSSVYGPMPCCLDMQIPRWNFQQYLVGRQSDPGGRFVVDWDRSGAIDYGEFVPAQSGGLDVVTGGTYACCAKSAFTPQGRRVLLHAGVANGGTGGNKSENLFGLARDQYFDLGGNFKQAFVPELRTLRTGEGRRVLESLVPEYSGVRGNRSCVPPRSGSVACQLFPVSYANQFELRAKLVGASKQSGFSWGWW